MPRVKVIHTAGLDARMLSVEDYVIQFKKNFSPKDKIDILIFVRSSIDWRISLEESMTLVFLRMIMT
jgi:hypothetical protein